MNGDRVLRRVDRRRHERGLEVVELELRGLADDRRGLVHVVHRRQLDHDLVRALLADLGLGDAELVDAVAHDVDRAVEVLGRELVAARRLRLQHDLEAALEVEALAQRLVDRRAREREQRDADERREQPDGSDASDAELGEVIGVS